MAGGETSDYEFPWVSTVVITLKSKIRVSEYHRSARSLSSPSLLRSGSSIVLKVAIYDVVRYAG